MRARGVLLRDRSTDPGCDGYVRITVGVEEHVTRGLMALRESLAEIGLEQSNARVNQTAARRERKGVGVMPRDHPQRKKVVVLCASVACMAAAVRRAEGASDAGWRHDRTAGGHAGVCDGPICEVEEARQMKKTASKRVSKPASGVTPSAQSKRNTTETQIALTLTSMGPASTRSRPASASSTTCWSCLRGTAASI